MCKYQNKVTLQGTKKFDNNFILFIGSYLHSLGGKNFGESEIKLNRYQTKQYHMSLLY